MRLPTPGCTATTGLIEQCTCVVRQECGRCRFRCRQREARAVSRTRGADRLDQVDQIVRDMTALALQVPVAFPLQRNIEEWELPHMVITGEEPCRRVAQHIARIEMLAKIHGNVEAIGREPIAQRLVLRLADLLRPQPRYGVEEFELDEFVDAVLDLGKGTRGAARQHVDRGGWKDLLQPAHRRDRGHEVADVIDLHHQDPLDVRMAEQRMPGEDRLHRFIVRPVVVRMA